MIKTLRKTIFSHSTYSLLFILSTLFTSFAYTEAAHEPEAVYLTWKAHPESSMTICWITSSENQNDQVLYKKVDEQQWKSALGVHAPLPEGHSEYFIHSVDISCLESDSRYHFQLSPEGSLFSFRTMPAVLNHPIRFVVGGDLYHTNIKFLNGTSQQAAKFNPYFALLGGDIAYAAPKNPTQKENIQRWFDFLQSWQKYMVTSDGDLVPILPTISNEDTKGRYDQTPAQAPFFYAIFPMPGLQGYNVLDFTDYMSIWLLDSGHTHPIYGLQIEWLKKTLAERQQVPTKFVAYHVPAYPSIRNYNEKKSPIIRRYWVPLFEKFGILAAFEHHDHAYKRTYPILHHRIDPKGIIYIGDGGWGVENPRSRWPNDFRWYLEKSIPKRHFTVVTLNPNQSREFLAVDDEGIVIDEFRIE